MNVINRMVDLFRKRRILKAAVKCGCDVDGDMLVYKNTYYIVDCVHNYVVRCKIPLDNSVIDDQGGENHGI